MAVTTLPRKSLQPLVVIDLTHNLGAVQHSGVIRVFGGSVSQGTTPTGGIITSHSRPFTEPIKVVMYSIRLHKAAGAIGELNGGFIVKELGGGAGQAGNLFGWASDLHAANAWFENFRTVPLSCPVYLRKDSELYFAWLINNLTGAAADFAICGKLYWTYATEEELE